MDDENIVVVNDENIVVVNDEEDEKQTDDSIMDDVSEPIHEMEPMDKPDKLHRLPLARVKNLIKLDPDVHMASQEATFLLTKATELFIEVLTQEAYSFTQQAKKKTLQKKDLDSAIDQIDALVFLEGTLED